MSINFTLSAAGWTLLAIGVVLVPLWAAYIIDGKCPSLKNLKAATKPKHNWGPKSPALKNEWKKFQTDRRDQRAAADKITQHGRIRRCLRSAFGF